ncbi:hypothetical protein LguiB_013274 [Lonicera macranthoides]
MGLIHHVNVVRLVGFCADGINRALIYEFLPNKSLEKLLFSETQNKTFLGWEKLQEIALGIARGIEYLHQGCDHQILHFDIKPHNILLDDNFNPKIADFGQAKLCPRDQSKVSMTAARGTTGYIAPESDVYSFGMLLLEMVGGRKKIDLTVQNPSQMSFPELIYDRLCRGEELGIKIEEEEHAQIAKKLTIVGLCCIQWSPLDRPPMKTVVQMLEGKGDMLAMPPNPFASIGRHESSNKPTRAINRELEVISEVEFFLECHRCIGVRLYGLNHSQLIITGPLHDMATALITFVNCHAHGRMVEKREMEIDKVEKPNELERDCSFIQAIDFTSIAGISQNPKCVHTFNEHIIELEPPNSIKNNIDSGDGQSSENTIIVVPLDSNFDGIDCNLDNGKSHLDPNGHCEQPYKLKPDDDCLFNLSLATCEQSLSMVGSNSSHTKNNVKEIKIDVTQIFTMVEVSTGKVTYYHTIWRFGLS